MSINDKCDKTSTWLRSIFRWILIVIFTNDLSKKYRSCSLGFKAKCFHLVSRSGFLLIIFGRSKSLIPTTENRRNWLNYKKQIVERPWTWVAANQSRTYICTFAEKKVQHYQMSHYSSILFAVVTSFLSIFMTLLKTFSDNPNWMPCQGAEAKNQLNFF